MKRLVLVGIDLDTAPPIQVQLLEQMLKQAGLSREEVDFGQIIPSKHKAIVALGNEAAASLIEDWHVAMGRAYGIELMRGFGFVYKGIPVIPTIHPSNVIKQWVPWRMLVPRDIAKANGDLSLPVRDVQVVDVTNVSRAMKAVRQSHLTACDIETTGTDTLACVGFAPSPCEAWVFPPPF